MRLTWRGPEIMAKAASAAAIAVDRTMALCVSSAKDNHPPYPPASEPYTRFASRTGHSVAAIQIFHEAELAGFIIAGDWGTDAAAGLYLEIGTSTAGPTAQERADMGDGDMGLIPPPVGPLMAPRPYLRPAADEHYPLLGARMGAAFRGESMP